MNKAVLAYSGGLDTTVAVHWLSKKLGYEVVAVAVDVGQREDLESIRLRALESGAVDAVVVDAVDEFASDFLAPAILSNARYQGKYPLVSALSRPLISKHLVRVARESGATAVAHGCTGKGNDQVRFEVSLSALAPDLEVLAPVRDWGMSRDEAASFGVEAGLHFDADSGSGYSIDQNLWGRTVECGELEDPWREAPADVWERTVDPAEAPREASQLEIKFEKGIPCALDGKDLSLRELISKAEAAAGAFGVGRVDMIEDRVVGIKSREIYEVPAATMLIDAHVDLEELVLEREVLRTKRYLEQRWAEIVYQGWWYSPLREAIDSFMNVAAESVNGLSRVKFEPGSARVVGRSSDVSLYDEALATYESGDAFDHDSAGGFTRLFGLPLKIWSRRHRKGGSFE